ncbi:NUDIX domain-containing protein [Bacillus pinisoli]|uniref:NUDIX domain-containing protein n=1 Tax=Bacillus pinisoli TaxID=2901866 RepID=UPI001FF63988|nr:NUDIX hydrolase [Bacillus pinisoli]
MTSKKRGNVWLAVAGLVVNETGDWLVVKKKYGGLKGKWSIPAGFVQENETIDEAVIREVKEETGIMCKVQGVLGIRSGVIKNEISDNMIIFSLKMVGEQEIITQEEELYEAVFKSPEQLKVDDQTSVLLRYYMEMQENQLTSMNETINPGDQFGYTSYKLFY